MNLGVGTDGQGEVAVEAKLGRLGRGAEAVLVWKRVRSRSLVAREEGGNEEETDKDVL